MKICFIGLGSIGTRHLSNLVKILSERGIEYEIHALRTSNRELPEDVEKLFDKQFTSYETMGDDYDIVFITNPTNKHYETLKNVFSKTNHIFIEKPLFMDLKNGIETISVKPGSVCYVAAPLRYNGVFPVIEDFVKKNRVFSARAICSSYLPEWRKNIDYRDNYSAKKDMGGGVSLDLIHEWDYLKLLFGKPRKLSYMCGKKSELEIDSDDIAVYIAEYTDKIVELHLDYFGRRSVRQLELFMHNGTLRADFISQNVSFDNGVEINNIPVKKINDPYILEMNYFIDLCTGVEMDNLNDIKNAYDTLKIALGELSELE